jgi:hypothetical protein
MGITARLAAAVVVVLNTTGCMSARLVLESPVADQCTSAGLNGCPELTEGVLLYVDGDSAAGQQKIVAGARQNEPAKLKEFASTVEKLSDLPGVSSYAGTIHAVAVALATSAEEQKQKSSASARDAQRARYVRVAAKVADEETGGVAPVPVDLSEDSDPPPAKTSVVTGTDIQGGTLIPMIETGALPCQVGAPIGAAMLCLNAAIGPVVLTDVHAAGECRSDLYLVDGAPDAPRWTLELPARGALHITGARLFVRSGEALAIAISDKSRADSRCAVTWSGAKP